MKILLISATITLVATLLTLTAAFAYVHRHAASQSPRVAGLPAADVHPDPHAGLQSRCPAQPHAVSPRPTPMAKAVIRT